MINLINSDSLKHDIINDDALEDAVKDYLIAKIDGMETVFDVDAVVKQLEALKHPYTTFADGYGMLNEYDYYIGKAKDIVKGAVKDE